MYHTWCSCGERQAEDTSLSVCVHVPMYAGVGKCIRECGRACVCVCVSKMGVVCVSDVLVNK